MSVFAAGRNVKSYVPPSVTTFFVTGARPYVDSVTVTVSPVAPFGMLPKTFTELP